jgi:hypothetical protein
VQESRGKRINYKIKSYKQSRDHLEKKTIQTLFLPPSQKRRLLGRELGEPGKAVCHLGGRWKTPEATMHQRCAWQTKVGYQRHLRAKEEGEIRRLSEG